MANAGLRVVAEASVLATADPKAFAAYELMADRFLAKAPMAGMCAFSAATSGLSDLFAVHRVRSADGGREPTAGAWFDGRVLRLVGEVDLTAETVVDSVIGALIAGDQDELDPPAVVRRCCAAVNLHHFAAAMEPS